MPAVGLVFSHCLLLQLLLHHFYAFLILILGLRRIYHNLYGALVQFPVFLYFSIEENASNETDYACNEADD